MKYVIILRSSIMGLLIAICSFLVVTSQVYADEKDIALKKTHRTWEGIYKKLRQHVISIEGQSDLYVIVYACPHAKGNLLDLATMDEDGNITFLLEQVGKRKGVTAILEGIDVFPGDGTSEIILRWMNPGNGRIRRIQKYQYDSNSMHLLEEARRSKDAKWIKVVKNTESDSVGVREATSEDAGK